MLDRKLLTLKCVLVDKMQFRCNQTSKWYAPKPGGPLSL